MVWWIVQMLVRAVVAAYMIGKLYEVLITWKCYGLWSRLMPRKGAATGGETGQQGYSPDGAGVVGPSFTKYLEAPPKKTKVPPPEVLDTFNPDEMEETKGQTTVPPEIEEEMRSFVDYGDEWDDGTAIGGSTIEELERSSQEPANEWGTDAMDSEAQQIAKAQAAAGEQVERLLEHLPNDDPDPGEGPPETLPDPDGFDMDRIA